MSAPLLAGLIFGLLTAVLTGTAAMDVMQTAARRGLAYAAVAGAGVAAGDALWATVAVTAGWAIRRVLLPWTGMLQWAAVAALVVILVLAVRELLRGVPPDGTRGLPDSRWRAFGVFLAHTVRHPTTVILFGSLIIGTASHSAPAVAVAFVSGVVVASLSWQLLLAVAGARRGRSFSDRARRGVLALDCVLLCLLIAYIGFGLYAH